MTEGSKRAGRVLRQFFNIGDAGVVRGPSVVTEVTGTGKIKVSTDSAEHTLMECCKIVDVGDTVLAFTDDRGNKLVFSGLRRGEPPPEIPRSSALIAVLFDRDYTDSAWLGEENAALAESHCDLRTEPGWIKYNATGSDLNRVLGLWSPADALFVATYPLTGETWLEIAERYCQFPLWRTAGGSSDLFSKANKPNWFIHNRPLRMKALSAAEFVVVYAMSTYMYGSYFGVLAPVGYNQADWGVTCLISHGKQTVLNVARLADTSLSPFSFTNGWDTGTLEECPGFDSASGIGTAVTQVNVDIYRSDVDSCRDGHGTADQIGGASRGEIDIVALTAEEEEDGASYELRITIGYTCRIGTQTVLGNRIRSMGRHAYIVVRLLRDGSVAPSSPVTYHSAYVDSVDHSAILAPMLGNPACSAPVDDPAAAERRIWLPGAKHYDFYNTNIYTFTSYWGYIRPATETDPAARFDYPGRAVDVLIAERNAEDTAYRGIVGVVHGKLYAFLDLWDAGRSGLWDYEVGWFYYGIPPESGGNDKAIPVLTDLSRVTGIHWQAYGEFVIAGCKATDDVPGITHGDDMNYRNDLHTPNAMALVKLGDDGEIVVRPLGKFPEGAHCGCPPTRYRRGMHYDSHIYDDGYVLRDLQFTEGLYHPFDPAVWCLIPDQKF